MKIKNLTKGRWNQTSLMRKEIKEIASTIDAEITSAEYVIVDKQENRAFFLTWLYSEDKIYVVEGTAEYNEVRNRVEMFWLRIDERYKWNE